MLIIPAIDLKDGECVRLRQGRMGCEKDEHQRTLHDCSGHQDLRFDPKGANGRSEGSPVGRVIGAGQCATRP